MSKINPNDNAFPMIIDDVSKNQITASGLSKREKLIFDLYVKFSSIDPAFAKANAKAAIDCADILFAEMNKESK